MNNDEFREDVFYDEETYSKGLSREETLEKQIRLIAYNYSKGMWDDFEYSLKALLPLLPKLIRERFDPLEHDTSSGGIERHYKQFGDIQAMLESETSMIWKKKFIRTYE